MTYLRGMVVRFSRSVHRSNILCRLKRSAPADCYKVVQRKLSDQSKSVVPIRMAHSSFKSGLPVTVPIIIMHGLFGSKTNWYSLSKLIVKETGKDVFVVDARNHGDSPHTKEHTYFHLAEDVKYFMAENNIEKADLVGHSMGGRAMMAFAIINPQKVNSLTVVDISPVGTPNSMKSMKVIFDAMVGINKMMGDSLSSVRKTVEAKLKSALHSSDLANFLSMNIAEKLKGQFDWKLNLDTLYKSYEPHITVFPLAGGEFKGPTIFVCGANSDFVDPNDFEKIKKIFPNASFVQVADAGHWVHAEQPKKCAEIMCNFIKSVN